jgi:transglutaminase-like putative cysteine protease
MIYDVRQSTTYHYASPVADAYHVIRMTPIDRNGQRVNATALDVDPVPAERRDSTDFFGNRFTAVKIQEAHDTLTVKVAARIVVEAPAAHDPMQTPAWDAVRAQVFAATDLGARAPVHHLFPSRIVSLDPEIRDYAALSFKPGRPILAAAVELMHRIKTDFTYEPGATTATTTPPMSFALRRGVCQDFSHIMISGLRGLGVPAAYVSGYLRTIPPPGKARLEGADAMHAWVLAWCGDAIGWVGLDPTNDMFTGTDHVTLAVGRDYADVSPIDGVVIAAGGQKLEVEVDVVPVN